MGLSQKWQGTVVIFTVVWNLWCIACPIPCTRGDLGTGINAPEGSSTKQLSLCGLTTEGDRLGDEVIGDNWPRPGSVCNRRLWGTIGMPSELLRLRGIGLNWMVGGSVLVIGFWVRGRGLGIGAHWGGWLENIFPLWLEPFDWESSREEMGAGQLSLPKGFSECISFSICLDIPDILHAGTSSEFRIINGKPRPKMTHTKDKITKSKDKISQTKVHSKKLSHH